MRLDNNSSQSGLENWLSYSFSPEVEKVIEEIDIPEEWVTDTSRGRDKSINTEEKFRIWIGTRVMKAEKILEEKGIDLSRTALKPAMDFDGPINKVDSSEKEIHQGFSKAFSNFPEREGVMRPIIISGRDNRYLEQAFEDMGIEEIEIAGEMGVVYASEGNKRIFRKEGFSSGKPGIEHYSDKIEIDRTIWKKAADESRRITWATSLSPNSGTVMIEPDNKINSLKYEKNRNKAYFDNYRQNSGIEGIWDSIQRTSEMLGVQHSFRKEKPLIIFDDTEQNSRILSTVLNIHRPYSELKFFRKEDKIAFYPSPEPDSDFSEKEARNFIEDVLDEANRNLRESFEYEHHSDGWIDFMRSKISKEKTANAIVKEKLEGDQNSSDAIISYVGDRRKDVFKGENTLFFAQIGRASKNYCEKHDIPHITVNNAVDYLIVLAELINRKK